MQLYHGQGSKWGQNGGGRGQKSVKMARVRLCTPGQTYQNYPYPTSLYAVERGRLGVEPLARLFSRVCRPIASPLTVEACAYGLVALDGRLVDVADTPVNAAAFEPERARCFSPSADCLFVRVRHACNVRCLGRSVGLSAMGALGRGGYVGI